MILTALRRLWQPLEVEATLALAAGLTAALLLTHPDYFDQRPGVYGHALALPWLSEEWHWGLFAAVACGLMVVGFVLTIVPATRAAGHQIRMGGLSISCMFWFGFAGFLLFGSGPNLGSVLCGTVAVFSARGLAVGPGEMRCER